MHRWFTYPTSLYVAAALLLALVVALGDRPGGVGRLWALFGPIDQGPIDFATLARRHGPDDALVCSRSLCRAPPDVPAPLYALDADTLQREIRRVILADGNVEQVAWQAGRSGDRYVIRSPIVRFPDTVDVLVLPQADGHATLAIYARGLLSRAIMSRNAEHLNRARLLRWLDDPVLREAVRGAATEPVDRG